MNKTVIKVHYLIWIKWQNGKQSTEYLNNEQNNNINKITIKCEFIATYIYKMYVIDIRSCQLVLLQVRPC